MNIYKWKIIIHYLNSDNKEISKCFYNNVNTEIFIEPPIIMDINSTTKTSSSSYSENKSSEIAYNSSEIYSNKKIGKIIQEDFITLLRSEKINDDILNLLQNNSYSKQFFDVKYPILILINSDYEVKTKGIDSTGRNRYYTKSFKIHEKSYLLTAQWFDRSKDKLIHWMKNYL